jgi:cysteine desulfurase/selenocysteine lyase
MGKEQEQYQGIPGPDLIQQMANEYFKAMPGSPIQNNGGPITGNDAPRDLPTDPAQFTRTSPASSGLGASPSAIDHGRSFNLTDPPTSLPDPHFSDGRVPSSIAGSGASKTAVANPEHFDLAEPPLNLPDPLFAGTGLIPHSVPGTKNDIKEPTASDQPIKPFGPASLQVGHIPYTAELPYEKALKGMAGLFQPAFSSTGLPGLQSIVQEPSFYFMHGRESISKNGISFPGNTTAPFDVNLIRRDFPILEEHVNGRRIVWLDNAATTQKPKQVIDRISYFYRHENSNIHRAAHELAARATDAYELARRKLQHFLNASSINEIVFVRGATEAINLVAKSWGEQNLKEGDEILISHLEHHANIVPWQQLAERNGAILKVIPVDDDGQLLMEEYGKLLGPKTRIVSFTHVSNALGTITPARKMVEMAHAAGAKALVDGAQSVSHMRVDVKDLDCDWYVFSGHKVFGPTGIGVLYGKEEILNATQPWQGGGNMIADVRFEKTIYQKAPARWEAGTGNIADAVGLGAAIDYVSRIGIDMISAYEHQLLVYATRQLKQVPGIRLIGTAAEKAGVLSFVMEGYRTEEIGSALNQFGVAVRSGHHCAQPILRRFGVESSVRPSLALYNNCNDIDTMIAVLLRLSSNRSLRFSGIQVQ